jgi:hypothetical protein
MNLRPKFRFAARLALFVPLLCFLTGCPRYTTHLNYSLGAGDIRRINIVDAQKYEQTVKVKVFSPVVPVAVYVAIDSMADEVAQQLERQRVPDRSAVLGSAEGRDNVELEVKVPKKKAYSIFVTGADKPGDIKVTISGD